MKISKEWVANKESEDSMWRNGLRQDKNQN